MGTSWSGGERPTQADKRRERFYEHAATAKAIADVALEDIDVVLGEQVQHSELYEIWLHDEKLHIVD